MCDGHDIGLSINAGDEVERGATEACATATTPRIFIYDAYPAASASASRCSRCTPICWRERAS